MSVVTSGCDVLGGGHPEMGGAAAGYYRAVSFKDDSWSWHLLLNIMRGRGREKKLGNWGESGFFGNII